MILDIVIVVLAVTYLVSEEDTSTTIFWFVYGYPFTADYNEVHQQCQWVWCSRSNRFAAFVYYAMRYDHVHEDIVVSWFLFAVVI